MRFSAAGNVGLNSPSEPLHLYREPESEVAGPVVATIFGGAVNVESLVVDGSGACASVHYLAIRADAL